MRVAKKCKLREWQETSRAKGQKDPTSVAEAFTLTNELLSSVNAHTSMPGCAVRVNRLEDLKVDPDNMTNERYESSKLLYDLFLEQVELRKSAEAAE